MKYFFLCVALATLASGQDVNPAPVTTIEPRTTKSEAGSKETATIGQTKTKAGSKTTDFECPGLGNYPDPLSKNSYYHCISDGEGGYVPIKIVCGKDMEYIPEKGTCDIPGEVGSTTANPGTDFECPGLGPYPDPLSKKSYYYCISDDEGGYIPIKLVCGKDTEYIPEMGMCGIPGGVGSTTPNPGTEGTTVEPEPFVCPGEGLYPNPVDKAKFYYCLPDGDGGYIPIPLQCGAGSEFNPETLECEKIEEITSTASTLTTPSTDTTTTTTELPGTTTTELPVTTESPTTPGPFKCSAEGIFADPMDQTKYYYCLPDADGGYRQVVNTCPLGLVYIPEKKYCSIPDKPFITTTPALTTTTAPSTFVCTRNGMFPDPGDKKSFYMCIFDGFGYISVTMQCHQGLVFIPALYRCALPDTPVTPPASIQCNGVGYYPDPNSCRDYYYCYSTFDGGYMAMKMNCPPGTNFFANMQICVSDKVLECATDNGEGSGEHHEEFECSGEGDFPILGNDRRYYSCELAADSTFTLKVKQCPIRFSIYLLRCVDELGL